MLLLAIVLITGCASSDESHMESKEFTSEAVVDSGLANDSSEYGGLQTNRKKIIQNAYVVMETLSFDDVVSKVKENTYEFKGYFESMRIDGKRMDVDDDMQNRYANYTIRIPKDKYEEFLSSFGKLGNIIVNELNSEDVTDRYIDTEARLSALKVQEQRLLEIMSNATEIEDIIALEERLSEVRYEIEKYTGDIRKWDNLVEFTTIQLEVREVREISEPVPDGLLKRSTEQFNNSIDTMSELLQMLVVLSFGVAPFFLVIIIPIGLVVRYFDKRRTRYGASKKTIIKKQKKTKDKETDK